MIDRFGRKIDYLRIAVTDECNLHCSYCMPSAGRDNAPNNSVLSMDEIVDVVRTAAELGIRRVRLAGGEPLLRPDLNHLMRALAGIDGIDDLAMTTNGMLLGEHAAALATAGLHRVNVGLDAIDPDSYAKITHGGDVQRVIAGILAARRAGLFPVKLNCVVIESSAERDAQDVARFAQAHGLVARFIRRMDLVTGRYYAASEGTAGDSPRCTRLRLSSDGKIRSCLFSPCSYDVRTLGPQQAILRAVEGKPVQGICCASRPLQHLV